MVDVVLIHGAWHGAWCWQLVVDELHRLGISSVAPDLPLTGLANDAATARAAIDAAGPGAVVVGHSYGGIVVSEAAAGAGDVARLVYVAAFMTEPGENELSILTTHGSPIGGALVAGEHGTEVDPARAAALFYADSDAPTAAAAVAQLRPMRGGGRLTGEPAWKTIPSTYVVCTADAVLPVAAQREMARRADVVVEWPTDHSPFLTRPGDLAALLASYR